MIFIVFQIYDSEYIRKNRKGSLEKELIYSVKYV